MMEKSQNAKEQRLQQDGLYNWARKVKARQVFGDFVERVKSGTVKNDGTDELLSIIDKYVLGAENGLFYKSVRKGSKLYRARIVDESMVKLDYGISVTKEGGLSGLNESESREAPLGIATEGRNNIKGVSYFYASNKPITACCEVKPGIRQFVSVAEFETLRAMRFVDFSSDKTLVPDDQIHLGVLFTDIMFLFFQPVTNIEEYRATQILTDYIRKSGVDGIIYRSYFDSMGINYTIFNSDHRRIRFVSSCLYLFQNERKTFLDINNKRVIPVESVGGASYDEKTRSSAFVDIQKALTTNKSKEHK